MKNETKKFYMICLLIYLSLIFSTSLHYIFGEEHAIQLTFYHANKHDRCKEFGNEEGILKNINIFNENYWKLSAYPHDTMEYLRQAKTINSAIAPFKYRFIPPLIAGTISKIFNLPIPYGFLIMNIVFILLTTLLFTYYLNNYFNLSKLLSLIGGMLFITMVTVTGTTAFPILEPSSMFFTILIFLAVKTKNISLFIISSIFGVATKEILIVSTILWFVNTFSLENKKILLKNIVISLIPIIAFSLIRVSLGGGATEVNFGFNVAQGEMPNYWQRWFIDIKSFSRLLLLIFLSFCFMWLGLFNINKEQFLLKSSIIIPLVLIASILFSWHIMRVIGIIFPIIITSFLIFLKEFDNKP